MFIRALFTIAKTWKQPQCPLTDEWIKKRHYIHTREYYSAIRKNEIMPFVLVLGREKENKYCTIRYHPSVGSK